MGVYIKGMTLKQLEMYNCDACPIEYFCKYAQSIDGYSMNGGRPTSCPLVEVPEQHGRLIDVDYVLSKLYKREPEFTEEIGWIQACIALLNHAPTVIEAEGE